MSHSYDHIAERWHSNPRSQTYINRVLGYVDRVLVDLPAGAKVLDLGCGTGNPIAKYIAMRGYAIIGVDESEKMLAIAKKVVPEGKLVQGDMIDIEFAKKFDAAVAWDSIFHVERKHHSAIYRKLANSLEIGARVLLSVGDSDARPEAEGEATNVDSDSEGFTSEMFGHTFFYSGYAPHIARQKLEAEGFEVEMWEVDDPSSRGHIAVIAKRVA